MVYYSVIESATKRSRTMNTLTIDTLRIKLFGKVGTMYRVLRNGSVIGVYETQAEAEAAKAAQA
jgi:hypothetical protein